ncbi:MAG TPA: AMP-binding protein, partial [Burkholderiales bacterium]|nr:AMP-binding protein [Burkholderiales bacterium]
MDGGVDRITERRPYNAVSDFVDAHIAAGRASKIAFVDPGRSLTYGDLQARTIRFANALRDLGIEEEQRVALLLNDTVDYPVAFWGTLRAGCVAVPLNIYLTLPQYAYILADCRARALVVEAS